jgi:hypothetical protein
MALGAPVCSVSNVNSIHNIRGPILILNPNLFPQNELRQVLSYGNGPIILVGGKTVLPEVPEYQFEDVYPPDSLFCAVYHSKKTFDVKIARDSEEIIPEDFSAIPESASWTKSSYFRRVSSSFIGACYSVISQCVDDPVVLSATDVSARGTGIELKTGSVQVMALKYSEKNLRLLISNKCYYYVTPTIGMKDKIDEIIIRTAYPPKPIGFREKEFRVRVPPKGMVILDIALV